METKMLKTSKQRMELLRILSETKNHPSAEWLYNEAKKVVPNISLATVYRNMKLLLETGQIISFNVGGIEHFDANYNNHYHFICKECNSILDLDVPIFEEIERVVEKMNNVTVSSHVTMFCGICENCKKRQDALN